MEKKRKNTNIEGFGGVFISSPAFAGSQHWRRLWDVGLCRRRAVEHARVEEDGDKDLFVHFAWIRGEEVSWPGCSWAAAWAAFVGRLLGCRGGLWQPGEPGKSLSFFFISVFFLCFVFLFLNSIQI
jgi:hypothetical protein